MPETTCSLCGGAGRLHPRRADGSVDYGSAVACSCCPPRPAVPPARPRPQAQPAAFFRLRESELDPIDFPCAPAWTSHYAREPRLENVTGYPPAFYEEPRLPDPARELEVGQVHRWLADRDAAIAHLRETIDRAVKPKPKPARPGGLVEL